MFGLKIFVRVQTFRPVRPCNFCHPASCQSYINYFALRTFEGGKVAFTKAPQDYSGPKRNNDTNCGNLHCLNIPRHFLSFNLRLGSVFISGRQNSNLSNLSTWPFSNMSICAKSLWPWHQPCTYFGDIWLSHYLDWIERNNQNQQTSHKQVMCDSPKWPDQSYLPIYYCQSLMNFSLCISLSYSSFISMISPS